MRLGTITGGADTRPDRAQARRQQRRWVANRGPWDELPRRHLNFGRFGTVTDERDGADRISHGEVEVDSRNIVGYFVDQHGDPVFLEPPPGGRR